MKKSDIQIGDGGQWVRTEVGYLDYGDTAQEFEAWTVEHKLEMVREIINELLNEKTK